MHISWLGGSAVKLQTKHQGNDVSLVIDPYKPTEKGSSFPKTLAPQIGLFTKGQDNSITLSGDPFIVDAPGEFEVSGVIIKGIPSEQGVILQLTIEGMHIVHLGALQSVPEDKVFDQLATTDILMIPVGGHETLSAKQAATITTKLIEPRVCVPISFKQGKADAKQDSVDVFFKELGVNGSKAESKVIVSASKLPQEEMEVILLQH